MLIYMKPWIWVFILIFVFIFYFNRTPSIRLWTKIISHSFIHRSLFDFLIISIDNKCSWISFFVFWVHFTYSQFTLECICYVERRKHIINIALYMKIKMILGKRMLTLEYIHGKFFSITTDRYYTIHYMPLNNAQTNKKHYSIVLLV